MLAIEEPSAGHGDAAHLGKTIQEIAFDPFPHKKYASTARGAYIVVAFDEYSVFEVVPNVSGTVGYPLG
jgi:hypothetical protein